MSMRKMSRLQVIVTLAVFAIGAMFGAVGTIGVAATAYVLTGQSYEELKSAGREYIALVDAYRTKHGRYPSSFEEADVSAPKTRYGEWKYRPDASRQKYTLTVGDYDSWSPFTLIWSSESHSWYLDT